VWARLGAQVTVIELLPRILALGDVEIAGVLHKALSKQGLKINVDTKVVGASVQGGQVMVNAQRKGENLLFQGDKVLVAVGRRPFTSGWGLQKAGVALEERTGRVVVNERFETNVPGVYAIGDLIAGPMLAHNAQDAGVAVAELLAGQKPHVNYGTIPSVIYTWP